MTSREKSHSAETRSEKSAREQGPAEGESASACPVVAIGTSAGGLEALKRFFDAIPSDIGAAFVVIQHLAPDHESLTARLLDPHTEMPVEEIKESMVVNSNHVYVIPPNKYLTVQDNTLHLAEPVLQHGIRMPIDYFFRSLAAECRERAATTSASTRRAR